MSDEFDYGGEVADTANKFKQPTEGPRTARLAGLFRIGNFSDTFRGNGVAEVKDPAPFAVAIFHLYGKEDVNDDGSPMFFHKSFPLKKGSKSFLHQHFIPAFGGMKKHKGFGTMISYPVTIKLEGGKEKNDDNTPKYINFKSLSECTEEFLDMIEGNPKYAPLDDYYGFLKEEELTKEALERLHPTREFYGLVMQTEEFKAGTHPCQELIQSIFDSNPEHYTPSQKEKEEDEKAKATDKPSGTNTAGSLPKEAEAIDEEEEF